MALKRRIIKDLRAFQAPESQRNPTIFNGLQNQLLDFQVVAGLLRDVPLTPLDKEPPTALHRLSDTLPLSMRNM